MSTLGWPAVLAAQAPSVCRPADAVTADFIRELRRDMAGTSPLSHQHRDIAHLPVGTDVPIQVVTDEQACRKARAAYVADTRSYDRNTGQWNTPAIRVYLLRVDTLFCVWDSGTAMGEFQLVSTLDAHFNAVVSVMR